MSKNITGSSGDRKGEGVSESEAQRMISSQSSVSGQSTRPAVALQAPGHKYIVQSHHDMKSFGKSARPIAPAPPSQPVQSIAARHVQSSQANIPSIISPSLGPGGNEGLVSLNLITTTASSGLGTVAQNPISVPVTLSQASVLQLGSNTAAGNATVVQQGIPGSTIPMNILRAAGTGHPTQPQIQAFASNFSQLPRAAVLRHAASPALQIPSALNSGMSLPIARTPSLQPIKTTTAQAARSQSPAVGGQPSSQAQPQDLSRPNFHGSITPVTCTNVGPHPVHIPLNPVSAAISPDSTSIQARTIPAQVQKDTPGNIQQRLSVSLSVDGNLHQRMSTDISRSSLPFASQTKVNPPNLGPQGKVIASQPLSQQGAPIKSVNLAVSNPVMINSINPSQGSATTTMASSTASIPIAKVPPQRQHNLGSIPLSTAVHPSLTSPSLSAAPAPSSTAAPHTTMTVSTLPSSLAASLPSSAGDAVPGLPSTQSSSGIIITPDFQARPPGSIITMANLASSAQGNAPPAVVSQAESRTGAHNVQQIGIGPEDSMWYQHFVYRQVPQSPQVSQSASTIVRPGTNTLAFLPSQGKIQTQTPSLAASHLAALSSPVRMMMVDQFRQQQQQQQQQQQHPIHSAFSTGAITTNTAVDRANLSSRATMASNIYTASVGVQSQMPASSASGGLSAVPVSNPSSSPRPSILRKRTSEAAGIVIRKPNFSLNQESRCHSPPRVDINNTSISSPKISTKNFSPMSENSQSSTDTALSSNDATTPTHNHNDKGKGDGEECVENGPAAVSTVNNIPASPAISHTGSLSEASPRKRARKQLLNATEELKDNISSSDDELENNSNLLRGDSSKEHKHKDKDREIRGEYTDEDGVRWIRDKPKPTFVLLQPDFVNNKTRNNHFNRYTDVKPKEERRPTVNELSNQRGIMQKVNGWKLYFTASQLEELTEVEKDMQDQFLEVQGALAQIPTHKINSEEAVKVHEMSQANIQRCQLIQNQLSDARAAMIRTLDHKPRIQEIVNKHMSKRPIKKKERT